MTWLINFTGEPGGRCPKCLTRPVMTEHHYAVVVGMCKERRDAAVAMADYPEDIHDEATEHLCRGCPACGYEWCESPATREDMEQVKAGLAASSHD